MGPLTFQVREAGVPRCLLRLRHTSQAIELQITQEYTGQTAGTWCFLVPMWKSGTR